MVIAGIKIKKITGDKLKKGIKSASVPSSKLVFIEIIQWKSPDAIRYIRIKMYPIIELRKLLISLK